MPHEHGENQKPEESDYRQEIAKHEAPFLTLDPFLDLAVELDWRLRHAAPFVAPRIKFAVFTHDFSPKASRLRGWSLSGRKFFSCYKGLERRVDDYPQGRSSITSRWPEFTTSWDLWRQAISKWRFSESPARVLPHDFCWTGKQIAAGGNLFRLSLRGNRDYFPYEDLN
jgi:hypothetical protein